MARYVRTIYLYVVAFATLSMIVTGIVGAVGSIMAYNFPTVYYYSAYPAAEYDKTVVDSTNAGSGLDATISYEQQIKSYEENLKREELKVKRTNLKNMLTYSTVFIVGLPLFVLHWKLIEKERKEVEG